VTLSAQTPAAARAAAGLGGQTSIDLGDPQQSHLHLAALWRPGTLIELRVRADGRWAKHFHDGPRPAGIQAQRLKTGADVYVGVLPRTEAKQGGDALPTHANVIWCEADSEAALVRAMDYTPHAHIVVRSSPGKAHFYWLLNRDIPLEYIERGNKRLAHHLGCDPRATNAGRILRVAGTRNHKRGEAQRVAITRFETHNNVTAAGLVGELCDPAPPQALTAVVAKVCNVGLPSDADTEALRAVPAREYIPLLTGREVLRGFAQCPFHKGGQERTPSLSVGGPNDTLWLCFGCDEGGDVFTMAARMWGLREREDFPTIKTKLKEILR
jgi:hypothetical protein